MSSSTSFITISPGFLSFFDSFIHRRTAKSCKTLRCTLPTAACQDAGGTRRRRRLWIIWFVILKHSTARRGKPFNHPSHIRQQLRFIRDSHTEPSLPPRLPSLAGARWLVFEKRLMLICYSLIRAELMSASWGRKRIAGILINMIFPTFALLIIDSVA